MFPPLYIVGRARGQHASTLGRLLPLFLLHVPSALGEALPDFRCHHHHLAIVLVPISSTSSPSLAGSRRRGRHRASCVLISQVPSVWHYIGLDHDWIMKSRT